MFWQMIGGWLCWIFHCAVQALYHSGALPSPLSRAANRSLVEIIWTESGELWLPALGARKALALEQPSLLSLRCSRARGVQPCPVSSAGME
jgi:hypothetical protein